MKLHLLLLGIFGACTLSLGKGYAQSSDATTPELPGVICAENNHIQEHADALNLFFAKLDALQQGERSTVSILQIGDSHTQAGFFPGVIRDSLQQRFGNAGRGLIVPLKLNGTNEPSDYAITSTNAWQGHTCLTHTPDLENVGISGMVLYSTDTAIRFTLKSQQPFDRIWAFHHAQAPLLEAEDSLATGIQCPSMDNDQATLIPLNHAVREVTLTARLRDSLFTHPSFYGFSLENGDSGILYHSIGINGNSFTTLNRNPQIIAQATQLQPDLIIISLGTNDSYGSRFDRETVAAQIRKTIELLQRYLPAIPLLLTTPMECYCAKRVKGRTVRSPNPNVEALCQTLREEAQHAGCPVWDFFA
ncbi:MAG: GDSL-type esterase/lipase family protein, partial [Alistipes sp.]|nr:GDSL-type esterase/lipase family protein [Alistipes sp.]